MDWRSPITPLPDKPVPPPREREAEKQGISRRLMEVVCCPKCYGTKCVKVHTGKVVTRWKCSECEETWREPAKVGEHRAAVP